MASLAEIRAKLQANAQKLTPTSGGDNAIFIHWNIPEGSTTTLRFLPDGDPNNTFFWVERAMIKLPFKGIEGDPSSKEVEVQVPCVEMYNDGSVCPILSEVRPWWKDKSMEQLASKYWKKKSYLFQGFVVSTDLKEDRVPENLIRRFIINPQIFNVIPKALLDSEIPNLVTDYVNGLDFKITKSTKPGGKYADYSCTWARRERALDDREMAAINTHGLYDLKSYLPKKPTEVELKVMFEMFEASVAEKAFDMERWGQYFKPSKGYFNNNNAGSAEQYGNNARSTVEESRSIAAAVTPMTTTMSLQAETPAAADTSSESGERAKKIIEMIRQRQQQ